MKRAWSEATTRSEAKARWAPMPAAVPPTAAITGLSQSNTEAIKRWLPEAMSRATEPAGRSGAPSGWSASAGRSARRSAPVQKCLPVAASTTTRTLRSPLARSSSSMIRSRWAGDRALPTSGRLRVMRAIPASTWWRTWSSMGWSVMATGTVRDARRSDHPHG